MPLRPGQKWTQNELRSGIIQYQNSTPFEEEFITVSVRSQDGRWTGIVKVPIGLDAMVAVSHPDLKGKIKAYPNPANDYITIQSLPEHAIRTISVQDIQGRELYRQDVNSNHHLWRISTSTWTPGIIFLTVSTDRNTWTEKMVIQR